MRKARLKVSQACIEDVDYKTDRGLEKAQIAALADGAWLQRGQNLLFTGAAGSGKTWIACALAHQAGRQGPLARYWRVPRLFEEIRTAHGDGSYLKLIKRLAKTPYWYWTTGALLPRQLRTVPICSKSSTTASTLAPP